MGVNCGGTQPQ